MQSPYVHACESVCFYVCWQAHMHRLEEFRSKADSVSQILNLNSFSIQAIYTYWHEKYLSCNLEGSHKTWSLPMADPGRPLTHTAPTRCTHWSSPWGAGDVGACVVWQRNKSHEASESPLGTLVSSLRFITIFPLFLPFHLQSIAGSKPLASGKMVNSGGRLDGAGADMGKDRVNITKGIFNEFKSHFWQWKRTQK